MRAAALATAFAFGCATVREPLPPPPPAPPMARVGVAEPEVILWVEGASSVDPAFAAKALAESRAALAAALRGRGAAPADGPADAVLQVRERAVVRTGGRKANQALAAAGMVIGFLVVLAVIVVAAVRGSGSSGGKPAPKATSGGRTTAPAPPRAGWGGVALPAPPLRPPAPRGTAPAPPPGTVVLPGPPPPAPDVNVAVGIEVPIPLPAGEPPPEAPPAWEPPAPPPFDPKERGLFDGEETLLDLQIEDARTGAVIWSASVRGWVDPRDREHLSKLLDEVLRDQAWARPPQAPRPAAPPG